MASTYSNLKIQLMATGENNSTWGTVTNVNLGTAIEEAITGSVDVTFASGDVTLTLTNTNATQSARNLRLNCTGTTGGARNLILGSGCQIEKVYIVNNGCADAITIKNTTGSGIAVPAGKTMYVFNNGTDVVDAITHLSSLTLASALPIASGGTGSNTATFSGANISNLNGSNVTSGTITNARTTASSSNGANTIIARGASGEFAAGAITGASFSGDGSALTSLNASSISSGTLPIARGGTGASDAATARANLGAGTGNGTVTSVATSGSVNGLTLTGGTITTTGTITLGGSVNASTISTGVLAIANGGTGSSTAAFSGANITSLNASSISSGTLASARLPTGTAINNVTYTDGSYQSFSGYTAIPIDNTVPQSSEGALAFSTSYACAFSDSKLRIQVVVNIISSSGSRYLTAALFSDASSNAIAASTQFENDAGVLRILTFTAETSPGTTSSRTYSVRVSDNGPNTIYINGTTSAGLFGGVYYSSMSITEIKG